ncbi:MAG: lytic murein transglycosylase B [Cyclobacteriaceae bacterium]
MRLKTNIFFLIVLLGFAQYLNAQVNQEKVDAFARNYAYKNKIPLTEIETILAKAEFQQSIIEKMQKPAEKTMTWARYRNIFMTDERISRGVEFWNEHEAVLNDISQKTGVPAEIILGILGVETFFGERKGTYKVLDALYTLAFGYPKRSKFFTSELEKFIQLSREENLNIDEVKGSYAGAIGYCQFMPSSYLAYAKSYDEGGNKDLVNSPEDAIASVANYLKVHRWKNGEPIAARTYKDNSSTALPKQSLKPKQTIEFYEKNGFKSKDKISTDALVTLLTMTLEEGEEYWFGFNNFYVITRYNHSSLYALAVYQLAEAIKARK